MTYDDILEALDRLPDLREPMPARFECAPNVWAHLKSQARREHSDYIFLEALDGNRAYYGLPVVVRRSAPDGWFVLYDQRDNHLRTSANFASWNPQDAMSPAELDEEKPRG